MRKIFALIMVLVSLSAVAVAENVPEYYPLLTIVVEIYPEDDLVVCLDKFGDEWLIFGADIWSIGDLCNMQMKNNGEYYTEHEITELYWEGTIPIEQMEEFIDRWMEAE